MSRSYKKYAVTSCTTSASEKNDKRIAHRVFRKRAKRALKNNKLSLLPFRMRDVSNIWCFAKDGKVTWEYLSSHSFFRRIVTDEQLQDIRGRKFYCNALCEANIDRCNILRIYCWLCMRLKIERYDNAGIKDF